MEPLTEAATDDALAHEKYVVFKKHQFFEMMGYLALPPWRDEHTGDLVGTDLDSAPLAAEIIKTVEASRLKDAVVIRRQDYFAGPALATYASMIALAAKTADAEVRTSIMKVADYFEDQAQLAAEEGWKFPD